MAYFLFIFSIFLLFSASRQFKSLKSQKKRGLASIKMTIGCQKNYPQKSGTFSRKTAKNLGKTEVFLGDIFFVSP